jgi:hypothetical protein
MTTVLEGQAYWKAGDHVHVWVVDAVVPARAGQPAFAVLVSKDGRRTEDVDLTHLDNPNLYTRVP